jgi:hypothetical protein
MTFVPSALRGMGRARLASFFLPGSDRIHGDQTGSISVFSRISPRQFGHFAGSSRRCFRHQMLLSRTRNLILNRERCCRVDEREHDLERCQKDYFRAEDLPQR